jgi:hypothetical protein
MLSLTLFRNPTSARDPENAYRKPLVFLNIVPEAGCDTYTGENQPIAEKQKHKFTNGREEKPD